MKGGRRRRGGVDPDEVAKNMSDKEVSKGLPDKNTRGARRRSRKLRGGNGYGFSGAIGTNGPQWDANMTSTPDGKPYIPDGLKGGKRRSRKSRKGGKKSRRRTMRGGGSIGVVGAGFAGTGSRGIADYVPYAANVPPGGAFAIPTGTR